MKKFDKRYIFYSLLPDLFKSFVITFVFLSDLFADEEGNIMDFSAAISFLAAAIAIIFIGFTVYRIIYYNTSGYELSENEIRCNRGVLFRKRSILEYKNVHAVNKRQNLIHKLFGIAILTVDSGSTNTAHQAEVMIIESSAVIDSLLNELNSLKESGTRASTAEKEEVLLSEDDALYRFTSKKKMLYALINIATAAFFTAVFGALAITVIGICKLMLQLDVFGTWGEYLLGSLLIVSGAMLLFSIFAFIGSLINSFIGYYNFSITKRGNEIRISYGLLERHTNTFGYDKIKAIKISQGIVQRILGFATIKLEVIGYTTEGGENSNEVGILVPFCKFGEIDDIIRKVLPDFIPDKKQSKAVSYFPFVSWFGLILSIVTSLVILQAIIPMMIFDVSSSVTVGVALGLIGAAAAVFAVKALSAFLCYKNNGIAIGDGKITAYSGGFIRNITVFKSKNLIAAENVTTPLRKKAGITSLVLHLKTNANTNEIKVHIQDEKLASELENLLMI